MSESMGFGETSSKTRAFPKWAKPLFQQFMPVGQEALGAFDFRNQPLREMGVDELTKQVGGFYLKPEANPYVEGIADEITRRSQEAFGQNLAASQSFAQRGGTLFSTKTAQAGGEIARRASADLSGQLQALYGDQYNQERARQTAAVPQVLDESDYLFKLAASVANLLKAPQSSTKQLQLQQQSSL